MEADLQRITIVISSGEEYKMISLDKLGETLSQLQERQYGIYVLIANESMTSDDEYDMVINGKTSQLESLKYDIISIYNLKNIR